MKKLNYLIERFGFKKAGLGWLTGVDRASITSYLNSGKELSKKAQRNIAIFFSCTDSLFNDDDDSKFIRVFIYKNTEEGKTNITKEFISLNEFITFEKDPNTIMIFSPIDVPKNNITNIQQKLRVDIFILDNNKISRPFAEAYALDSYYSLLFLFANQSYFDNSKLKKGDCILSENGEGSAVDLKINTALRQFRILDTYVDEKALKTNIFDIN